MTKQETESLLRYMITMYPNVRMTEQQFDATVQIWAKEFEDDNCDLVGAAFRLARSESPDWMPSVPKIQYAMRMIASRTKVKTPEQEFADTHCGKTKEEWDKLIDWERSSDGASKIRYYKEQFIKLLGGKV